MSKQYDAATRGINKVKKTVFWWKCICLHLQQFTVLKILSEMKENSVLKKAKNKRKHMNK